MTHYAAHDQSESPRRSPRDDNRFINPDRDYDQRYGSDQRYGWHQEAQSDRGYAADERYGSGHEEFATRRQSTYANARGPHRESWPRNEDRENYAPRPDYNYAPNASDQSSYRNQSSGYGGDMQHWQEREGARAGAFGIQNHRGKGPQGYTRSDERIKEDICEQLCDHHFIDASHIRVEVSQGVVTLEGSIDDRWQKYQAEDLVDATSGVKDIHNRLTVARQNPPTASNPEQLGKGVSAASAAAKAQM